MAASKTPNPISGEQQSSRSRGLKLVNRGIRQIGKTEYVMFVVCLCGMALTIITTWPLWQNRIDPPNLPLISGMSGISFGGLIILSILVAMIDPRRGIVLHFAVLLTAIAFDQLRCQPQIFSIPVLMAACVWRDMRPVCRWFLVAMWLWAGVHKLISPYWMGPSSWSLLDRMGLKSAMDWYTAFAWSAGIGEILLALIAIFKPKIAAPFCVALHLGIVGMLLAMNWNFSVLYWNIATAIAGSWLLWTASGESGSHPESAALPARIWPRKTWQQIIVVVLLIAPAGVYGGWTPHFLAHVLYSDHMPRAVISTNGGAWEISTWNSLHAPVPRVKRILRQYFDSVAEPGDKLHILDSRPWLDDQYFCMDERGRSRAIKPAVFFDANSGFVRGIAKDYEPAVFQFQQAGIRMVKKTEDGMIFAIEFSPQNYKLELLRQIKYFPNLEQIQLAGCDLKDSHLSELAEMPMLLGIGLDNTPVTNDCLRHLEKLPRLQHLEYQGTQLTDDEVRDLLRPFFQPVP